MSTARAAPRGVSILGSTGSIGVSALDVIARHPGRFRVIALSGYQRLDVLAAQCRQFAPELVAVPTAAAAQQLRGLVPASTRVAAGAEGLDAVAGHERADTVIAAIVGAAGLLPTLAAARAGKRLLLANKEALVMAGRLFMAEVARGGATLLPLDSEHNAIFQCLPAVGVDRGGVRRLILSASGGPFRTTSLEAIEAATPDEACAHPNWRMGRKISVDSATMMNKGLELIEACWLFGVGPDRIEILIHPQSIVHSLVEYADGSVLAQLGNPDMRTPIAHALGWPERIESGVARLDLTAIAQLQFSAPDPLRFPCLRLAHAAAAVMGDAPAALNAANEEAVTAFLAGKLRFTRIAAVVDQVMQHWCVAEPDCIDAVLDTDIRAREQARGFIERYVTEG
ncbi:MAG: 1-deoxy-D-xylulose-5-phosphate reductoisomerase [Gammaproteobacteria bacterium]|nr:1-deoxy-D-xylulose-5-phosphate reductoisomerase [Gammaproteobacteria bacterium]MBK9428448.1 1-deoxy-D-xylulose-5-phosphate reductoisomerase [Gammaproteobacteria bacterium]